MNPLIDALPADAAWFAEPVGAVDGARLASALGRIDPSKWQGRRVAIGELPAIEFAAALVFLDGLAASIVLLPSEDDDATRRQRLANVDVVLEGRGLGITALLSSDGPAFERPIAIATTWLMPTSGTTGTPKLVAHTLASLAGRMSRRRIPGAVWGSLYSLRRFAGLQVFLQAWLCGAPLVLNEEGADLREVLGRFAGHGCNALSATPSMWRKLAMHPSFDALKPKQITLGGEIVDQPVLDMLARRFPAARITHIYASTEAGVGFAVRDGLAGFPSDLIDAETMRVDDAGHLWFRRGDWIDSGDVVARHGDRIRFLGRANGSINVGGNKVMPEEVESVIAELPEIAFVQVRARASTLLGNLVEAAVTPSTGIELDTAFKRRVTAHCRERLDAFKVPAFIVAADAVRLSASGKLIRT